LKVYNIASKVRNYSYEPDVLLSGITGTPQKFMCHSGLITDEKLIYNFSNLNFFNKIFGKIPEKYFGIDFINYSDSYQRFYCDE
jgi:hypothetical protein